MVRAALGSFLFLTSAVVLPSSVRGERPLPELANQAPVVRVNPDQAPAPPLAQGTGPRNEPPVLIAPPRVTFISGASTVVPFEVADRETPATDVRVSVESLDRGVIPQEALRIDGGGSQRALTIAVPPGILGVARLNLTAIDAGGLATQLPIEATIREAPRAELARVLPPPAPRYAAVIEQPVLCGPGTGTIVQVTGSSVPEGWAPVPSGQMSAETIARSDGPTVEAPAARRVVPRHELIRGRTVDDGLSLFNAAYEYYWAGDYTQAREASAAAAQLCDDPRAWDYYALSSMMCGDLATAEAAARYSSARVLIEPSFRPEVGSALVRVQGPIRSRLNVLKSEVTDRRAAMAVLAARPRLIGAAPESVPVGKASAEALSTGR